MTLLLKLVLAHLIGNFLLQPSKWVQEKERRKLTEYILIGTLLSFGTAIVAGLIFLSI